MEKVEKQTHLVFTGLKSSYRFDSDTCNSVGVCEQLTSSAISSGEVSTLDHELLDDSVEFAALVTESFLNKTNKNTIL